MEKDIAQGQEIAKRRGIVLAHGSMEQRNIGLGPETTIAKIEKESDPTLVHFLGRGRDPEIEIEKHQGMTISMSNVNVRIIDPKVHIAKNEKVTTIVIEGEMREDGLQGRHLEEKYLFKYTTLHGVSVDHQPFST